MMDHNFGDGTRGVQLEFDAVALNALEIDLRSSTEGSI